MKLTKAELEVVYGVLDEKLEELQTSGKSDDATIEQIEIIINVMTEIEEIR